MEPKKQRVNESTKRSKFLISGVLAFLLSVSCTLLTFLLGGWIGFFSTEGMLQGMERSGYYEKVLAQFYEDAGDYTIPTGLPGSVLTGIVEEAQMKADTAGYLKASLEGVPYEFDTAGMEAVQKEQVREYFAEEGLTISQEQEEVLTGYTKETSEIYKKAAEFPLASYLGKFQSLYLKILKIGIPVCLVFIAAAVVMLLKMRHWKHRGIRFLAYGTLGTVLMTGIVPGMALASGVVRRLNLEPVYFYEFVTGHLERGLTVMLVLTGVWIAVSGVLIAAAAVMKKQVSGRSGKTGKAE